MNSRRIHVVSFGLALLLGIAGLSGCATRSPYHDEVARSREAERIRETLQKYAIFLDDGRVEDFLDLFTQDSHRTRSSPRTNSPTAGANPFASSSPRRPAVWGSRRDVYILGMKNQTDLVQPSGQVR